MVHGRIQPGNHHPLAYSREERKKFVSEKKCLQLGTCLADSRQRARRAIVGYWDQLFFAASRSLKLYHYHLIPIRHDREILESKIPLSQSSHAPVTLFFPRSRAARNRLVHNLRSRAPQI